MTKPQSYPILLQLPARQLESVFEVRVHCVPSVSSLVEKLDILFILLALPRVKGSSSNPRGAIYSASGESEHSPLSKSPR